MPGRNEIDQYLLICDLIGRPEGKDDWRDFFYLPNSDYLLNMARTKRNNIGAKFRDFPQSCVELLEDILCWDPAHRLTINEILLHPFFSEEPYPCAPDEFTKYFNKLQQI